MIRIAVCDDDRGMLENLIGIIERAFAKCTDDFKVFGYNEGRILLNEHRAETFDIVFLDIDMPTLSGFDIAKAMRDNFSNSFIVFVTSHAELVYESLDFQPFHFIRKNCRTPIEVSINKVAKKLMQHMKQNEKIILSDELYGECPIYVRDIIYMEGDQHYVNFCVAGRDVPLRVRETLKNCEDNYNKYDFVRIHKSYIVNLKYLSDIDSKNDIATVDSVNVKLPVGRGYKKAANDRYKLYLRTMI